MDSCRTSIQQVYLLSLQVAEVPLDSLSMGVVEQAIAFYKEFKLPVLYTFARTLVDAVFNDIPDSTRSAAQGPNVRSETVCVPTSAI